MMIRDSRRSAEHEVCTVLSVEDELLVRLTVAEELREAGMRVIEAANADEAIQHLRAENWVDFIFADVELPGSMNGLKLAQRVRADFPHLKLLITSGRIPEPESRFHQVVHTQALRHC
jgi:CheY-like chemotaxis protein